MWGRGLEYQSRQRDEMFATITQWIRDGSVLEDVFESSSHLMIDLRGADGCRETFICNYEE